MSTILKANTSPITDHRLQITSKSEGFTLIEVLVSAAILVILAAGFLGLQYILSQNQLTAWKSFLSIEAANISISTLSKEIRNARQSAEGAYPLEKTDDQEIIFYSDSDFDGQVERVRYTLSGSDLIKGIVEPSGDPPSYNLSSEKSKVITDIVRNGSSPLFYYYNSAWPTDTVNNPLPPSQRISETRQIKVILRTNPKANDADSDYILESDVKLRMLN